jgi:hypothetical protein
VLGEHTVINVFTFGERDRGLTSVEFDARIAKRVEECMYMLEMPQAC